MRSDLSAGSSSLHIPLFVQVLKLNALKSRCKILSKKFLQTLIQLQFSRVTFNKKSRKYSLNRLAASITICGFQKIKATSITRRLSTKKFQNILSKAMMRSVKVLNRSCKDTPTIGKSLKLSEKIKITKWELRASGVSKVNHRFSFRRKVKVHSVHHSYKA